MSIPAGHPIVVAAERLFVANEDGVRRARDAAEAAEAALAAVRVLPADCPAHEYEAALRAAYRAVLLAHREVEEAVESVRWLESAVGELEAFARAKFGAAQVIISLGYTPLHTPTSGARPRGPLLGNPI